MLFEMAELMAIYIEKVTLRITDAFLSYTGNSTETSLF